MNPRIGATDPASVASEVYQYHRLDPELVEQLVAIYRVMFPHDSIPDEFYKYVVQKLDEKAQQNLDFTCFLSEGVEALNAPTSSFWFDLPVEGKLAALKRSEQTPFFQTLRSDFVNFFYSNPAIWPRFGYQGPSNEQGGYLHRGFNDIDWIKSEGL